MTAVVLGATGYIGFAVAQKFRREGFRVLGTARSEKSAAILAQAEIKPILGDLDNLTSLDIASSCSIAIHCAADHGPNRAAYDRKGIDFLCKLRPHKLLYTSGCWIHGNSSQIVDEETPINPLSLVSWRPAHEKQVLDANGIVLRPGFVYGGSGGLCAMWFESANQGSVKIVDGNNTWSMIHRDDLAEAFFLAAHNSHSKTIFDITDGNFHTVKEMAIAVAHAAKIPGKIQTILNPAQKIGPLWEGLAVDQKISSKKAQHILKWQPKHGFIKDVDLYYRAWLMKQK